MPNFNDASSGSQPAQVSTGSPLSGPEATNWLTNQLFGNPAVTGPKGKNPQGNDLQNLLSQIGGLIPGLTTATTNAANQAQSSAIENEAGLYNQYAPGLNATQQQQGASNLQANANAIGSTLGSPAASSIIGSNVANQQQANPLYNQSMSGLSNATISANQATSPSSGILSGLNSLIGNINPNQFTGSQLDQISRGLAQSNQAGGNANLSGASPITSLNNAMTFGTGLQNMQSQYGNLVGQAAGTANTLGGTAANLGNVANNATNGVNNLNGGVSSFGLITGQPTGTSSANTGTTPNNFLQSPNTATTTAGGAANAGLTGFGTLTSIFNPANSSAAGQQKMTNNAFGGGVTPGPAGSI